MVLTDSDQWAGTHTHMWMCTHVHVAADATESRAMHWAELEAAAPEIARRGRERLASARVALLGTLRSDGSPRISPIEPYFVDGHLLLGAMAWSAKARDLLRDPRCVLHSAVSEPDAGVDELKLYGAAVEVRDPAVRDALDTAWWVGRPAEAARVFSLDIERAALISWDVENETMTLRRWSPELGLRESTHRYP